MLIFKYTARDSKGKKVRGSMHATRRESVAKSLLRQNLVPVRIKRGISFARIDTILVHLPLRKSKVLLFLMELSNLMRRGNTITKALELIHNATRSRTIRVISRGICKELYDGKSLDEAFKSYRIALRHILNNQFIHIEKGGSLSEVLDSICANETNKTFVKRQLVISIMPYLIVSYFILFSLSSYVVLWFPRWVVSAKYFGKNVFFSELFVSISRLIALRLYLVMIWILCIGILLLILNRIPKIKYVCHCIFTYIPVISFFTKSSNNIIFFSKLRFYLMSGCPLQKAFLFSMFSLVNIFLKKKTMQSSILLSKGESIKVAIKRNPLFSSADKDMLYLIPTQQLQEALPSIVDMKKSKFTLKANIIGYIIKTVLFIIVFCYVAAFYGVALFINFM